MSFRLLLTPHPSLLTIALLISLSALAATHWLTGEPKAEIAIQASVPVEGEGTAPGARIRFDVLRRSVTAMLDSLCRVARVRAPDDMVRALEDPSRETHLRGAIERRGFVPSQESATALRKVVAARRAFMTYLEQQPYYDVLMAAVFRVRGPLTEIPARPSAHALLPADLIREVRLYNPAGAHLYDALAADAPEPDRRMYALHAAWRDAVEAYERLYHRDLLERAVVAAALYRAEAVASAETDTLGQAVFPSIPYGRYWINGHYPQDTEELNHIHRRLLLGRTLPSLNTRPLLLAWDLPLEVAAFHPEVRLDESNAVHGGDSGE